MVKLVSEETLHDLNIIVFHKKTVVVLHIYQIVK